MLPVRSGSFRYDGTAGPGPLRFRVGDETAYAAVNLTAESESRIAPAPARRGASEPATSDDAARRPGSHLAYNPALDGIRGIAVLGPPTPKNRAFDYELDAILSVVMGGTLMTGGRFSMLASVIGAVVIWTFTVTVYALGVPANALLAAKAVLVMLVILLYSDYTRRFMNRLVERRGAQHGTAN